MPDPFLTDAQRDEIAEHAGHYPEKRAASVDALKIVQRDHGWVPDAAMPEIAELLDVGVAELEGVATFYNLIYRRPVGRHVIHVCDSISCHVMDGELVMTKLKDRLGIEPGQTTDDGRFTLLPICCLGNCDHAPTLLVGRDLHNDVEPAKLGELLEQYE